MRNGHAAANAKGTAGDLETGSRLLALVFVEIDFARDPGSSSSPDPFLSHAAASRPRRRGVWFVSDAVATGMSFTAEMAASPLGKRRETTRQGLDK